MSKKTTAVEDWAVELDRKVNELSSKEMRFKKWWYSQLRDGAVMAVITRVRDLDRSSTVSVVLKHQHKNVHDFRNDYLAGVCYQIYLKRYPSLIGQVRARASSGTLDYTVIVEREGCSEPVLCMDTNTKESKVVVAKKVDRIMRAIVNMVAEHASRFGGSR